MRPEWWAIVALLGIVGCDGPPPAVAPRAEASGHSAEVTALAYSPDGRTLVSRGADAIRVWDAATLREVASMPADGAEVGGLAISPDGKTLAATAVGRGVELHDMPDDSDRDALVTLKIPAVHLNGDGPPASAAPGGFGWGLAFAADGTLAGPSLDPAEGKPIQLWKVTRHEGTDPVEGTSTRLEPIGPGLPGTPATHLAFTPDGKTLVAKGMEGNLRIYDLAARAQLDSIDAGSSYLAGIAVSPDGRVVASSGSDRYLRLWEISTGKQVGRLRGHLKAILGVSFHPDGRHVVTGDSGGTIFLWDVPTQRVLAQFKGHQGKVWALAFRPDGRELASAGEDRRVRLWDIAKALAFDGQ